MKVNSGLIEPPDRNGKALSALHDLGKDDLSESQRALF
jgi:hypothetical protein